MLENGGVLDETCEQCHRKLWYPNCAAAGSLSGRADLRQPSMPLVDQQ
jgi:hypothetical protein